MNKVVALLWVALALALTACGGSTATPGAGTTPAAEATPTAETLPAAGETPVETPAEAAPVGDAANGQVLFNEVRSEVSFACSQCHRVDSEGRGAGPGLLHIGTTAATRVAGLTAEQYIAQSITEPGAFTVAGYPAQSMPRSYGQIFTAQEINDLVAYLLTL